MELDKCKNDVHFPFEIDLTNNDNETVMRLLNCKASVIANKCVLSSL